MKRIFDLVLASTGLITAFPVMVVIAVLIRINFGSPIFFKHIRPGLHGKPFMIIKFRSMINAYDENGNLLPDKQRMTPLGNFLRSTSLDELPELWNVVKGEMSLVGPRPLLMRYIPRYNSEQMRRHDVLPGITGLAQINGRNAITWEEKFKYDVWYVDNWSLWLDIKILFATVLQIFKREGISHEGYATSPEFRGSSKLNDKTALGK